MAGRRSNEPVEPFGYCGLDHQFGACGQLARRKPSILNEEIPMSSNSLLKTLVLSLGVSVLGATALALSSTDAAARSCAELRSLCHTMRDNKNDCTKPFQRCLSTGTFITPLGRVFKATR
jgi:hypothetical protein